MIAFLLRLLTIYLFVLKFVSRAVPPQCQEPCALFSADVTACPTRGCLCERPDVTNHLAQCAACDSTVADIYGGGTSAQAVANFTESCSCLAICAATPDLCSPQDEGCICSQTAADFAYSCAYCTAASGLTNLSQTILGTIQVQLAVCHRQGFSVTADTTFVSSILLPDGGLRTQITSVTQMFGSLSLPTATFAPTTPTSAPTPTSTPMPTPRTSHAGVDGHGIGTMLINAAVATIMVAIILSQMIT